MTAVHARDLDLNLLRVLVAVADSGSVTTAAARLYLTQSAVSAALRRLRNALETPVVARLGRGVVLTQRAARLVAEARPHLDALLSAALAPAQFDARTSERTFRMGFADSSEEWLLPCVLRFLEREAPRMRLICTPTQFRTVGDALMTRRLDLALTVADDLPQSISRLSLLRGRFVCLFDPHFVKLGARPSERAYLAQDHVIVSYNGDLRGVVEDVFHRERRVRCSVATFGSIGAIVEGSRLVATVPHIVAAHITQLRPRLRTAPIPFAHQGATMDLLWPAALELDEAFVFLRKAIVEAVKER